MTPTEPTRHMAITTLFAVLAIVCAVLAYHLFRVGAPYLAGMCVGAALTNLVNIPVRVRLVWWTAQVEVLKGKARR